MRNSFIRALEENATERTFLIIGDLGFGVVNRFKEKYPKQFLNAGVAEQNMTGLAAGMALEGKKVFTYSIANFNTLRAIEQIRNDVAYHNLNVTITSVGGGLAYGSLGISHHATEDMAILRSIPNLTVFAPGDTVESYEITKLIIHEDMGPVYLRLGRAGEATLHTEESIKGLAVGKAMPILKNPKSELAILSTGGMLEIAFEVNNQLKTKCDGINIFSFHTIKPFDKETVLNIFKNFKYIISLEEHSIVGGFASAILECLPGSSGINLAGYIPFALPSAFTSVVGDQKYLRNFYGISSEKIMDTINQNFKFK